MVAFIAGHGMRPHERLCDRRHSSVLFEDDDNPDGWKDFVELAKAANSPFLTMSEFVLEKADIEILLEHLREENFPEQETPEIEEAQYLVNFVGRTGFSAARLQLPGRDVRLRDLDGVVRPLSGADGDDRRLRRQHHRGRERHGLILLGASRWPQRQRRTSAAKAASL